MLPRAIATRDAFENAMTLDVAMGGSTNTVLHLLAAAQEAELDFTMARHRRRSRAACPCVCKVAPNGTYLMEDVHRAGGIPAILGELRPRRAAARGRRTPCTRRRWTQWLGDWDVRGGVGDRRGDRAVPRRARLRALGDRLLAVRALGVAGHRRGRGLHPRRRRTPTRADGGLAILYGNLAERRLRREDRRASTSRSWTFTGPAVVVESQEAAVDAILGGRRRAPATWSSSATRARAAARACRRCSTRPPT